MRPRASALLCCAFVALAACSQPVTEPAAPGDEPAAEKPAEESPEGTVYGSPLDDVETVTIAQLYERADELAGKPVRLEGSVVDVCAKRGCWFDIAGDAQFRTVKFKVVDGVMVFPLSMRGKHAVADGKVKKVRLDLERTKTHLAQLAAEKGETFDPATVTEPMDLIMLEGIGARVRDAR